MDKLPQSIGHHDLIMDLYHELQCLYLIDNLKEIADMEDRSYKNGDLWIIGDNVEIKNDIISNLEKHLKVSE